MFSEIITVSECIFSDCHKLLFLINEVLEIVPGNKTNHQYKNLFFFENVIVSNILFNYLQNWTCL